MSNARWTGSKSVRRGAWRAAAVALPVLLAVPAAQGSVSAAAEAPPVQHFASRPDLTPPVLDVRTPAGPDVAPGSLFFTARKGAVQPGPVIMDNDGQLVWSGAKNYPGATDFRVQQFHGRPVLTFWQGSVDGGHGSGEDVILDSHYRRIATVKAGLGQTSDLHEFQLTPYGTALVTAYKEVPADLSSVGGPKNGWVLDGVFREIDVTTGLVLYDWHSLNHVPVSDTYINPDGLGTKDKPLDYFHINSVSRAADGDYLVSGRHTHTVYRVDHLSKDPEWRLGGKHSDFALGEGVRFDWQHNARFYGNEHTLSLFDNADDNPTAPPNRAPSRGEIVNLDTVADKATLVRDYPDPDGGVSFSQGNVAPQANGDVVIGWGSQPQISEFSRDGKLLYDATFGEGLDSYRAYRFDWHATPTDDPAVSATANPDRGTDVAVSWNGATEVTQWRLLAGPDADHLSEASTVDRAGFETPIAGPQAGVVQVQALDANGRVIGSSEPTEVAQP